jgi:hypothetical protein
MDKGNKNFNNTDKLDQDNQDEVILDLETENLSGLSIVKFVIYKHEKEHIISFNFNDDKKCFIPFIPGRISATNLLREIKKKLFQTLGQVDDHKAVNNALIYIENQIIENRYKVFDTYSSPDLNNNKQNNFLNSEFINDVIKLREQLIRSCLSYEDWQSKVAEKYDYLKKVIEKHYPEAWTFMEFCLAVKSILNVQDITLPFMGVLLAVPSSMKTMIIQLFRKYPQTFYTDSFTPASLISHNSTKTEEELQKVDMIPKMKDKVVLTPELAPIFTSKEDDLQKVMGIATRLLDGHGLENDSGAHGHRRYGDTMFTWLGAAVEIPPRVWKILGTLGHKIYFLRPNLRKKTIEDLIEIAKNNKFSENNKEIQDALLDYLKTFDAAPEIDKKIKLSGQIVKVKWNEEVEGEQSKAIKCIAQLANLLAHLRGTVYVSESKAFSFRNNNGNNQSQQQQHRIEGQDYDTDSPIIEDPSRAVILLSNLALAHAISQGRDYLNLTDIPIIIKVALSTAPIRRVKVLDFLLKSNNGEITTSQITNHLSLSQPTATRTMRELDALEIVDISAISEYGNSELKIKLKAEFVWFKDPEFLKLKEDFIPAEDKDFENRQNDSIDEINEDVVNNNGACDLSESFENLNSILSFANTKDDQKNNNSKACDNNELCHTFKPNPPPETHIKNDDVCDNLKEESVDRYGNSKSFNPVLNDDLFQQQPQETDYSITEKELLRCNNSNNDTNIPESLKENNNDASPSAISFERVTEIYCHILKLKILYM